MIAEPAAETTSTRHRGRTIVLWLLQIITAAGFLGAALGKFTGAHEVMTTFDAIGLGDWFRYLIATLEVAGAVALFVPRLAGLAALALTALLVGALLVQIFVVGSGAAAPVPLLVLSVLIAWGRRESTARLRASFTRR